MSAFDNDNDCLHYYQQRTRDLEKEVKALKQSAWDEFFKSAIIATACTAAEIENAAEVADAAMVARGKRMGGAM